MDSRHYCSRNGCGSLAESGTKRCSEHTANMTLRERCEKAWFDNEMDSIDGIESFAREIRQDALREAIEIVESADFKRADYSSWKVQAQIVGKLALALAAGRLGENNNE